MNDGGHGVANPQHGRHTRILAFLALAVLAGALEWNWFAMPFERDEGEYAYAAWLLREGGVPYRDSFLHKPPGIVYTYWLAQKLGGDGCWPPRALGFAAVLGTAGLIALCGRKTIGTVGGWVAAGLYVAGLGVPMLSGIAANTEKFMMPFVMGAAALWLSGRERERNGWHWAGAGACVGGGLLFKQIGLPVLGTMLAMWLAEDIRRLGWRRGIRGGCAGAGAALAVLGLGTLPIALKGALAEMWECTVAYNLQEIGGRSGGWMYFAFFCRLAGWPCAPLAGLAAVGGLAGWRRSWRWGVLGMVALGTVYMAFHGHYYILALPFLALLAGAGAAAAGGWAGGRGGRGKAVAAAVGGAAGAILVWNHGAMLLAGPETLSRMAYGPRNPFVESREAAKRLAERTEEGEEVFMLGSEPQILYYARRKNCGRHVVAYPLVYQSGWAEKYQDEAMGDLLRARPRAVVVDGWGPGWAGDRDLAVRYLTRSMREVKARYRQAGGWVPDRAGGRWKEPLEGDEEARSTLLLYVDEGKAGGAGDAGVGVRAGEGRETGGDWAEKEQAGESVGIAAKRSDS
jgi:hypothetical protein